MATRKGRINFEVPSEMMEDLAKSIPYGSLSRIIRSLIAAFLDLCQEKGSRKVLIAVVQRRIKLFIIEENIN